MKILILAAGYGTRLMSLAKDTPKPLLKIAGRPLLDHLLDKFAVLDGLDEMLVVTNEKFYGHFKAWAKEHASFPAPVTVVNDGTTCPDNRLGSVGDIDFVIKDRKVIDDLLIVGGDNLFDYSLVDFLAFAREKGPRVTIGLYDIHNLQDAVHFGVVETDTAGRIVSFEEKPDQPRSTLIAMCSYYLPKEALGTVGEYLNSSQKSDKAGDYIHWLAEQKGVFGFTFTGKWYDIGSVESYQEAQDKFQST